MNKNLYSTALLLMMGSAMAWSAQLTPEQALARALDQEAPMRVRGTNAQFSLALDQQSMGYYVFNNSENGFLVVSADDAAAPVLGYSSEGSFDPENMPESMAWWLSQRFAPARLDEASQEAIAPLLTTLWNQSTPYNDLCPLIQGTYTTVTGCVATAMAQVMNYHKYPEQGQGEISYIWSNTGETLSADFSTVVFDWDNMLDYYLGEYTEEQATAVATLMYNAGLSVETNYWQSSSNSSADDIVPSMPKYWNYDENAYVAYRAYHGQDAWHMMVYDQLKNVGPAIMAGSTASGQGHAFVCDGYDGDGYFHINWGWGGLSNGYFLLDVLDPENQGIGGGTSAYVDDIRCICGIQKPGATYIGYEYEADLVSVMAGTYKTDTAITFTVNKLRNLTANAIKAAFAVKMTNKATAESTYFTSSNYGASNLGSLRFFSDFKPAIKISSDLADGDYLMTPAIYDADNDKYYDVHWRLGTVGSYNVSKSGADITIDSYEAPNIKSYDLQAASSFVWCKTCEMTFTLENEGSAEYYGYISGALFKDDKMWALSQSAPVDVLPGEPATYTIEPLFNIYFKNLGEPQPGAYSLCLVDEENKVISNYVEVELVDPLSIPQLSLQAISLDNSSAPIEFGEPFGATLKFANANPGSGDVEYRLSINAYTNQIIGEPIAQSELYSFFIEGNATVTISQEYVISEKTIDQEMPEGSYALVVYDGEGTRLGYYKYLVNYVDAGIHDIAADGIKVSIDGLKLSVEGLAAGSEVRVISLNGSVVYSGASHQVELPAPGVYLLQASGNVVKIICRQ